MVNIKNLLKGREFSISRPFLGKSIMMNWSQYKQLYFHRFLYLIMAYNIIVIILSPIFRGLYFDREWFLLNIITLILAAALIAFKFDNDNKLLFNSQTDYLVFLFVIIYLVASLNAVDSKLAYNEFFKVLNYSIIYFFTRIILKELKPFQRISSYILNAFIVAGIFVALIGLAGASGFMQFPGLYDGTRIHSTLQYHNANAIYMTALFFLAIGLSNLQKHWQGKILYIGAAQLFFLSVILTYSRGAWLVLTFCLAAYFILALPGQRLKNAVYVTAIVLLNLLSISRFEIFISSKNITAVLLLLFSLVAILAGIVYLVERFSYKINEKIANISIVIFTVIIVFMTVFSAINSTEANQVVLQNRQIAEQSAGVNFTSSNLPAHNVINRLSKINLEDYSVTERFIYYRTSLKIARDYLLMGAGGGAWEVLYLDYLDEWHPDFMYTVEVHNHYLKILIETGVFGLLSFLAIWFFFIRAFFRSRFSKENTPAQKQMALTIFIPALALGAHGVIDFSLSLGAISIFLWILFALGVSNADEKLSPFIQEVFNKLYKQFPFIRLLPSMMFILILLALIFVIILYKNY